MEILSLSLKIKRKTDEPLQRAMWYIMGIMIDDGYIELQIDQREFSQVALKDDEGFSEVCKWKEPSIGSLSNENSVNN